jgi:hypothetical protein
LCIFNIFRVYSILFMYLFLAQLVAMMLAQVIGMGWCGMVENGPHAAMTQRAGLGSGSLACAA